AELPRVRRVPGRSGPEHEEGVEAGADRGLLPGPHGGGGDLPQPVVPHAAVQPGARGARSPLHHDAAPPAGRHGQARDRLLLPRPQGRTAGVQARGSPVLHPGVRAGRHLRAGRSRELGACDAVREVVDRPPAAGRLPLHHGDGERARSGLRRARSRGDAVRQRHQLPQPVGHMVRLPDREGVVEVSARVPAQTVFEIQDFLNREALAVDERRFRDWLEYFADDLKYEVPLRVTREGLAEWEVSPTARIFDDDKRTLTLRVERLETDFAWAEQPPSRTRHLVTGVVVDPGEADGEYQVKSNCLI